MKPRFSTRAALLVLPLTITTAFSQNESTELAPLTVTARADEAKDTYVAPTATTGGLKVDVPLLETPQPVTVIGEELIQDQDAVKLEDVLRNVAGVSTGGIYGAYDQYRIRGFDASYKTYWDGLRGDNGRAPELYGLEKVEVVKGPASTLYGNAPLGGLVNLVSKRPYRTFGGEVGVSGGSFNTYEGTFDLNAPLYTPGSANTGAKSGVAQGSTGIYGRVVGLYRQSDTFIDYGDRERIFVAPSVLFQFSEDTQLTILASYTEDDEMTGMPLPASGTVLSNPNGDIPLDRFIGMPGEGSHTDFSRLRLGYEFSHRFNDVVSVRQNFNYTRIEQTWDRILYPQFGGTLINDRILTLTPYTYDDGSDRIGVDTAADFVFDTFSVKHTATVGLDYYYEKGTSHGVFDFMNPVMLDVFDPDYDQEVVRPDSLGPKSDSGTEMFGFYAQDHMKLSDCVSLTLGARFDSYQDRVTGFSETAISPKAGVTWEFVKNVAAYANYGKSFNPQNSPALGGEAIEPQEGENFEVGVKANSADGVYSGMASVFSLTRSDVAYSDISTADPYDYVLNGEERSLGFELEGAVRPLAGLEFTGAYTWLDAEVTSSETTEGNPLVGVPENTISAWAKYTLQDGPLKGLGFGFGGRALSSQSGDTDNTFDLPGYAVLDAALFYNCENFSAQLNFKNITDKEYFSGASGPFYVTPGEPFNVTASVGWKF